MSFLFEKKELILIAILFLILLLIVVIFGVLYKNISDEVLNLRKNISLVPSTNEKIENNENILDVEDEIYVEIKGCIKNPGVYKMTSLNRVFEVIDRAGGLTKNADTSKTNLSLALTDSMVIYIYSKDEIKKLNDDKDNLFYDTLIKDDVLNESNIDSKKEVENSKISINNASLEELMRLSGIGEVKALAIIEYRKKIGKFKTLDEIKNVKGISDAIYEKIKDDIKL